MFTPVLTVVEGVEAQVVRLDDLLRLARGPGADLAALMLEALEQNLWPEPLVRNHPTLTAVEQARLLRSKAVVLGLGGLGGHLATLLARCGVGHLVLVDGDAFDATNLNRQALCTLDTLGQSKSQVAARSCLAIQPGLATTVWETIFTPDNGPDILEGAHVVLDGLDKVATRRAACGLALSLKIPFIHGAVQGWSGQTATFLPDGGPGIDAIYPVGRDQEFPPSVLAPVVTVVAALQVQEAVRVLCGRTPANSGRLIFFDGLDTAFHKISLVSD